MRLSWRGGFWSAIPLSAFTASAKPNTNQPSPFQVACPFLNCAADSSLKNHKIQSKTETE
jgi:hypothetical protein